MSHRLPAPSTLLSAEQCAQLEAWFSARWAQAQQTAQSTARMHEPRDLAGDLAERCRKEIDRLLDPYVDIPEQPGAPDMASISPCFDAALRAAREAMPMLSDKEFWYIILGSMPQEVKSVLARSAKVIAVALNENAPINKLLPPELATAISAHLSLKNLIAASHVCHRWRRIIVDEPLLWNRLTIDATSLTRSPLSKLLARSQDAPLTLRIDHIFPDKVSAVASCVSKNLHRMEGLELHFSTDAPHSAPALIKMLTKPAPLLTHLRLLSRFRGENADATCHFVLPQEMFQGTAPKLKEVEFSDMRLSDSCPALAQVETVIAGYTRYSQSQHLRKTQMLRLFDVFPAVTNVVLTDVDAECVLPPLSEGHHVLSLSLRPPPSRTIPPEVLNDFDHTSIPHLSLHGRNTIELLETLTKELPPWKTLFLNTDTPKRRSLALLTAAVHCGDSHVRSVMLPPMDAFVRAFLDTRLDLVTTCTISEALIDSKSGPPFTRAPALETLYITVAPRKPKDGALLDLGTRVVNAPALSWVVLDGTGAITVSKTLAILAALDAPRLESLRVRKGVQFATIGNYPPVDVLERLVPLVIMEDREDMLSNL
ncbi:hypothetical protein AURDEDRAFT_175366 [Auricularia subglabra TFB-10046 SS5]|uniref:F-box domain-containing protein n=1 Tax=Auricularia subglabra (strain TFB-10046 / SS5) TaxID=717982 RepID=J0LF20_AURST|nr:hypothetical protein AURDEDRAFT_175366 [Auricularia subglabra TFB-10046 SS5]